MAILKKLTVFSLILITTTSCLSMSAKTPCEMEKVVALPNGPKISLEKIDVNEPSYTNRKIIINVVLKPLDKIKRDSPFFINILNNQQKIVGRFCHHPLKPTHLWKTNEQVEIETITLPIYSHLEAGKYKLQMGLLNPDRIDDIGLITAPADTNETGPAKIEDIKNSTHYYPEFKTRYLAYPYSNKNIKDFIVAKFTIPNHPAKETENIKEDVKEKKKQLKQKFHEKYGPKTEYGIAVENGMRKISVDVTKLTASVTDSVKISLAKNEREPFQIILVPIEQHLRNVHMEATDLKNYETGSVIKKENVRFRLVKHIGTKEPNYNVDYVGPWADPLVNIRKEGFDVMAGTLQSVWVDVYAPKDTPAGIYNGQITIKTTSAKTKFVQLNVNVRNFELPEKMTFKMSSHLLRAFPPRHFESYLDNMMAHHVNPMDLCRAEYVLKKNGSIECKFSEETSKYIKFCMERGLNALCVDSSGWEVKKSMKVWDEKQEKLINMPLPDINSKEFEKILSSLSKGYCKYLKENGWMDMAFWELLNEPTILEYPTVNRLHQLVHEGCQEMKTVIKGPPPYPDLEKDVDIWCPLIGRFDKDECARQKNNGKNVFWHICNTPYPPYPNLYIDKDGIEPRILFWMAFKYGVEGLLYWSPNDWSGTFGPWENGRSWRTVNGDGCLLYPSKDGPIDSIRWENIRDGIEDYEYFHILKELVKNTKVTQDNKKLFQQAENILDVTENIVKNRCEFTKN